MTTIEYPESITDDLQAPRPTFYDLQNHAEAGFVRRAVTRYFVPRDYGKSIRLHKRLGTPIVRKAVLRTAGKLSEITSRSLLSTPLYGLNFRRGRHLEGANDFAFNGSVFNEAAHTLVAVGAIALGVVDELITKGPEVYADIPIAATQLALVALQRYNRARMVRYMDQRLQRGAEFNPDYRNWSGIDARAADNFRDAQALPPSETLAGMMLPEPSLQAQAV